MWAPKLHRFCTDFGSQCLGRIPATIAFVLVNRMSRIRSMCTFVSRALSRWVDAFLEKPIFSSRPAVAVRRFFFLQHPKANPQSFFHPFQLACSKAAAVNECPVWQR